MEEPDLNSYGRLWLDRKSNRWNLELDSRARVRAKRIFPNLDQSAGASLSLKSNGENCEDLNWFIERYPLEMSDKDAKELLARSEASKQLKHRTKVILRSDTLPQPANLKIPLRSYQRKTVSIAMATGGVLNGDVLGLGKTATGIGVISHQCARPAVVVCQTHLQEQWKKEIKKFCPDLRPEIVKTGKAYMLKGDVFIISYSKLAKWSERFVDMKVRSVVYDEIQELRHSSSAKHSGALWLSTNCSFRVGLSATPIYNYGGEIFNVLECVKKDVLGTREEFYREWCTFNGQNAVVNDPVALGKHLRDIGVFVRHTRAEVARELPDENRMIVDINYDESVMERNEFKNEELARQILEGSFHERGVAAREFDMRLRQATGLAKAPYVAEFVKELVDAGEKVLLFGWHREVYEVWRSKFQTEWQLPFWMYTGSESPGQKEMSANGFINSKKGVMVMSLRSGAGLNGLQDSCSVVAFGELDWSGKVHDQCVGRLLRDGQERKVSSMFFIADAGSDPVISTILGLKEDQSKGIVDLGEGSELDRQNVSGRITELAKNYLKNRTQLEKSA